MSKIGIQSQSGTIPDFRKVIEKHPVAWLLLGNAVGLQLARDIRAASPNTLILIRVPTADWAYRDLAFNAKYLEQALAGADPFQKLGLIDFLLSPNEPVIASDEEARQLNNAQVTYASALKQRGFRTGAYTFPVGNPDFRFWPFLQDGIRACDGWLFLHQYDIPNHPQILNWSLRHRKVRPLIAPDIDLKIGIPECLIDLGVDTSVFGRAGGFRNMPDNGHLMEDYIAHLTWWDAELAKDDYVKFACIYGYAMEQPWVGLGFDVAFDNDDRAKFIAWLGSAAVNLPPLTITQPPITQPQGGHVSTVQERLNAAWLSTGVPFNPASAFLLKAKSLGLRRPVAAEYRYAASNGQKMAGQGFEKAFLECVEGDFAPEHITAYDWLSGAVYVPVVTPVSPAGPGPIPFAVPQALTSIGASATEGTPVAGQPFYRLSGASIRSGVSAFCKVTVIGLNGVPAVGAQVVNLFPDGNGEILVTDGSGIVTFNYGPASAFTPPGVGPFTVFLANGAVKSEGPPKRVSFAVKLSDIIVSLGDPEGTHTEAYVQFVQMP